MKAVTWQGQHDISRRSRSDPVLVEPNDAIVKITSTGPCACDPHLNETLTPWSAGTN